MTHVTHPKSDPFDQLTHDPSTYEYQLRLGRQRQVWLIPIADERVGVQVYAHDDVVHVK